MLKVALTGAIATGKSYVIDQFRRRGVVCLDADALAHGVMASGTEATTAIAARFGAGVLAADGSVDRAKLGPVVFADPAARHELEAMVHPAVFRAIAAGLRGFARLGDVPLAVVDIPLLYETGHEGDFDTVVATVCPPEMQIRRLIERGLTEEAARLRLLAQWPAEQKAARANVVIRTDGSFEQTDQQVEQVLSRLLSAER